MTVREKTCCRCRIVIPEDVQDYMIHSECDEPDHFGDICEPCALKVKEEYNPAADEPVYLDGTPADQWKPWP